MIRRILVEGWTVQKASSVYSISVRTVRKWLQRYREEGVPGLENRSSRPHRFGNSYIAGWSSIIDKLRQLRLTGLEIAKRLRLPRSTVADLLRRNGLGQLKMLDPKAPIVRYERDRPGDMVHLDIKKLARFDRPGHRVTGDRSQESPGAGYEFVHVCIDDHSRAAYVEILPDERGQTCAQFLIRAVLWFASKGITVRRVMTDNGMGYISLVFREAREGLGLLHKRTRPYTPKTNGRPRSPDRVSFGNPIERLLTFYSRTLHQNHARRMGLHLSIQIIQEPKPGLAKLAQRVQSKKTAHRPWWKSALRQIEGHIVNNLSGLHS